jgi:hypothetical protein
VSRLQRTQNPPGPQYCVAGKRVQSPSIVQLVHEFPEHFGAVMVGHWAFVIHWTQLPPEQKGVVGNWEHWLSKVQEVQTFPIQEEAEVLRHWES